MPFDLSQPWQSLYLDPVKERRATRRTRVQERVLRRSRGEMFGDAAEPRVPICHSRLALALPEYSTISRANSCREITFIVPIYLARTSEL